MLNKAVVLDNLKSFTTYKDGHWLFGGYLTHSGHGQVRIDGVAYRVNRLSAHFFLNLDLNDKEKQANHKEDICTHKNCWNPEHLYIGTQQENLADKWKQGHVLGRQSHINRANLTHCKWGHEFTKKNTYITSEGKRQCKMCKKMRAESGRIQANG